ncbi:hypothetical protein MJ585_01370 [Klebsiella pneumoniae]|nr:hypothetical protein MJ585_01370 [Klebsiella pneumoniae]
MPEEKGSFLKFCQLLGGRLVTEFNYRLLMPKTPVFLSGYGWS